MELIHKVKLTNEQIDEIRALENRCKQYDGTQKELFLNSEFNFHRKMNCFFMFYDACELKAVLTIFAPIRNIAEISICILPSYRQRGVFKELLAAACSELEKYKIDSLLFVHELTSIAGRDVMHKWQIPCEHSEYLLRYKGSRKKKYANSLVKISFVQEEDVIEVAKLNSLVFGESLSDAKCMAQDVFNNLEVLSYCIRLKGEIIGVCNVNLKGESLSIFGLGIAPSHQGKGYGRILLNQVIEALSDYPDEITLEVDSTNKKAFNLYTTNGFVIKTQYDYHKCSLMRAKTLCCTQLV